MKKREEKKIGLKSFNTIFPGFIWLCKYEYKNNFDTKLNNLDNRNKSQANKIAQTTANSGEQKIKRHFWNSDKCSLDDLHFPFVRFGFDWLCGKGWQIGVL